MDQFRKVEIDNLTLAMAFYAFRYCLGRRTYAVSDCVEWLNRNWNLFTSVEQIRIQNEIREAIDRKQAGAEFDIEEWRKLLAIKNN